jgi:hypothetical protein
VEDILNKGPYTFSGTAYDHVIPHVTAVEH